MFNRPLPGQGQKELQDCEEHAESNEGHEGHEGHDGHEGHEGHESSKDAGGWAALPLRCFLTSWIFVDIIRFETALGWTDSLQSMELADKKRNQTAF